jgi:hypothetical protein
MSGPDRRHAVSVAKETIELLGGEEPKRELVAAALMHDVGKVEASLGTFARVGVTLAAMATGRRRLLSWSRADDADQQPGGRRRASLRVRVGRYLAHDRLGAVLLVGAGSDAVTSTWAREHHLPAERWTLDVKAGAALKAADGD